LLQREQNQRPLSSFGGLQRGQTPGTSSSFRPLQREQIRQPTSQQEPAQRPLSSFGGLQRGQTPGTSSSFRRLQREQIQQPTSQQEPAQRPLSLFGTLQQEQAQRLSPSSPFIPLSQSGTNAIQPLPSNPRPSSSWQTTSFPTSNSKQTASNTYTTGHLSQPNLNALPQQRMSQNRSQFTSAANVSPLRSSEQSFSSASSYSQPRVPALSQLPPLPYDPFSAPESGRQNRPATPLASQTSTVQQQTTRGARSLSSNSLALNKFPPSQTTQPDLPLVRRQPSLSSASDRKSAASPLPLVRREDFWQSPKRSTSWAMSFFVILMVVLIIASAAILVVQANNRNNRSGDQHQSTSHANVTGTVPSQLLVITVPDQIERSLDGDRNGK
jgi:hypothetical protein